MSDILVIGDAHVDDEQDLSRFDALGNYILDKKPEYVVIIGDFLSFNCLSAWDRDKRKLMENRRYSSEIEAGNEALNRMAMPLQEWRKRRKQSYSPSVIYLEGNHEDRLTRYLQGDPTFDGQVGVVKDLYLEERGIEYVPFKENFNIDGVSFTHIPISSSGRPISNPTCAQKALRLYHNSVVFGHTHTLDHCAEHKQNAPHLNQALSVGCFFEHVDEYAKGSMTNYWRGIVHLNTYSENRFDYQTIAMSRLKEGWL